MYDSSNISIEESTIRPLVADDVPMVGDAIGGSQDDPPFTHPFPSLGLTLLVGILLQSGGFFVHMLTGEEGAATAGTWLTHFGAVLLAVALVSLGDGLIRTRRHEVRS